MGTKDNPNRYFNEITNYIMNGLLFANNICILDKCLHTSVDNQINAPT